MKSNHLNKMVDEDKQPLMGLYDEAGWPALPKVKQTLIQKWDKISSKSKFMIHCGIVTLYTVLFLVVFFAIYHPPNEASCPQPGEFAAF
jgi:hypothetical protein